MLNLLNTSQARFVSVGEASLYALIGFLVVFLGISFLILIVWLVGKIFESRKKAVKSEATKQAAKKEESSNVNVASAEAIAKAVEDVVDEETVAVIMGALMAYYEQNNPKCEFTVKRIKRI